MSCVTGHERHLQQADVHPPILVEAGRPQSTGSHGPAYSSAENSASDLTVGADTRLSPLMSTDIWRSGRPGSGRQGPRTVTEIVDIPNRSRALTIECSWCEVCDRALTFVRRFG